MLFGSTSKLQPANQDDDIQSQGVSQYAVPVGISIAVVVVVLAIVVYLIIRRKYENFAFPCLRYYTQLTSLCKDGFVVLKNGIRYKKKSLQQCAP